MLCHRLFVYISIVSVIVCLYVSIVFVDFFFDKLLYTYLIRLQIDYPDMHIFLRIEISFLRFLFLV